MPPQVQYRLAGLGLAAVAMVLAGVAGVVDLGEQSAIDADTLTIDAPAYVVESPVAAGVTVPAPSPTVSSDPSLGVTLIVPVAPAAPADRVGNATQATPTLPPPPSPPVDGDCESWRPLLERYGIPFDEAQPVMWRESRCAMAHNGTASTRDDSWGPLQVNRWGSLAAWWDAGGYTADVMATPEGAVAAAAVLYHSCGWSPWRKPYGCDGDYLQSPEPRWGEW